MELLDIWRSAKLMVDQHGDQAPLECAMKADAFLDEGNPTGQKLWLAIRRAAAALLDKAPAATYGRQPEDYAGPYRAWGPALDKEEAPGRHEWQSEVAPTLDGFTRIRPHAVEWWDGKAWIGTD